MSKIDPNRCRRCNIYAGAELTWHNGCVYCADDDDEEVIEKRTIREENRFLSDTIDRLWRKHGREYEYDHRASLESKLQAIEESLNDKENLIQLLRLKFEEEQMEESEHGLLRKINGKMKDNEVYHGMVGGRLGRYWWASSLGDNSEGSPGQVSFDWQKIMDREDSNGDVVGFYHTHPHCVGQPSSTDYATMGAWTLSFGRPLLCLIEGTDGLNAHWFKDDETRHKTGRVWKFGKYFIGTIPTFE